MKRLLLRLLVALIVLAGIGAGVWRLRKVQAAATFPVAPARKGDFLVIVRCRGELRARNSHQIVAPNVPQLRIVWQAPAGGPIKQGDPVIRFDPSAAKQQLQEKDAGLKQAQATLEQAQANARITAEQDKRDVSSARYDVETARLEASKQEIVSAIQGEESRIDLGLAEQQLRVEEAMVGLHAASDNSKIASLTRLRDQAQSDVDLWKGRLAQMELKAPSDGIVVYLSNNSQGWMNAKPFKIGDQVWPGAAVAEVPDLATLEMEGKVDEIDRGRIAVGDDVRVRVDSLPEASLAARLDSISLLTVQTFEWPPTSSFRGYAMLTKPDPRLRPGMNGSMDVVVNRITDAISVPAKAVFTHQGKPIVYLAEKNRYRAVEVKVLARNPDEVAISGIQAGAMVTLTEAANQEHKK
jgi:multidrug efflux pump subunit AcrA (membrane-fusion protein)